MGCSHLLFRSAFAPGTAGERGPHRGSPDGVQVSPASTQSENPTVVSLNF